MDCDGPEPGCCRIWRGSIERVVTTACRGPGPFPTSHPNSSAGCHCMRPSRPHASNWECSASIMRIFATLFSSDLWLDPHFAVMSRLGSSSQEIFNHLPQLTPATMAYLSPLIGSIGVNHNVPKAGHCYGRSLHSKLPLRCPLIILIVPRSNKYTKRIENPSIGLIWCF